MLEYTRGEAKAWARKNYRGLESCIYPSFTPNLRQLDEEGIRHDVRHEAEQGFFSVLICTGSAGMSFEERLRFIEIVCDEAKGKILTSAYVEHDDFADALEILAHHEKVGGNHALLGFPQNYYPKTEDDAYRVFEKLCNSTNLAIDIYPTGKFNLHRFHPGSGFPPEFMERLSDLPNVVGMKIGHGPIEIPGYTEECYRRCGDKILVNQPDIRWWPVATQKYNSKWTGAVPWHAYQTPDNPRAVQCFEMFLNGETDRALEIYWQLMPIWTAIHAGPGVSYGGVYHYQAWKYCQWLVGGNGGLLRLPMHRLYEHDALAIKAAMKKAGVGVRDAPFEEFLIGRLNYEKGLRITI